MNRRKSFLVKKDHIPEKTKFPSIDTHNHLWGSRDLGPVLKTLDAVGVVGFVDLTGNVDIKFSDGGYSVAAAEISDFFEVTSKYPGRFYCFTMSSFARDTSTPLFEDAGLFVEGCVETLRDHIKKGALGLKVLKELGLEHRDANGDLIHVDDERLSPIWEEAGRLGVPVLIHQADPDGFFEPVIPSNEHYETMIKYPSWSFADFKYPRKEEIIKRRDHLVGRHKNTTFILPHVANLATDLGRVAQLLDDHPNVYIDFSARIDELGRQPYSARQFFIDYQDRIFFGVDMPANIESSLDIYRTFIRFLETKDEFFFAPDYDGTFSRARWPIYGLGLPDEVLKKIYYKNFLNLFPDLKETIPGLPKND